MSACACGAQRPAGSRGNKSLRLAGSLQPGAFHRSVVITTTLITAPALTG